MLLPPNTYIGEPTTPEQQTHLQKMNVFFGPDFPDKSYKEIMFMNLAYGVINTHSLNEYVDTMHTALYWLNHNYEHTFKLESASDVMKTYTRMKAGEEKIEDYKMDATFSDWLTAVVYDTPQLRDLFLESLKQSERDFIGNIILYSDEQEIIETFCLTWIKKIQDPTVLVAFGHYMTYMMTKATLAMNGEETENIQAVMTDVHALIMSSSKICVMASHNMGMN